MLAPGSRAHGGDRALDPEVRAGEPAPWQRVRRLEFSELPKTISGKIRRVELRAREEDLAAARRRPRGHRVARRHVPRPQGLQRRLRPLATSAVAGLAGAVDPGEHLPSGTSTGLMMTPSAPSRPRRSSSPGSRRPSRRRQAPRPGSARHAAARAPRHPGCRGGAGRAAPGRASAPARSAPPGCRWSPPAGRRPDAAGRCGPSASGWRGCPRRTAGPRRARRRAGPRPRIPWTIRMTADRF